jgi:hypothetical protein
MVAPAGATNGIATGLKRAEVAKVSALAPFARLTRLFSSRPTCLFWKSTRVHRRATLPARKLHPARRVTVHASTNPS